MTLQNLADCIAQGEGPHLEFKQRVPAPERMAKEITAFANTHGGQILIGVGDAGAVTGVKDAAEEEYALRQALEQYVEPPVALETNRVRISRKRDIIVVTVHESPDKPHFVSDLVSLRRTAYVRVEDKSVEASREARRLMRRRETDRDILIKVGDKERVLLQYMASHGCITVAQFAEAAAIPRSLASLTLVHLTRARMLSHHADVHEDYFTHGPELTQA